MLGGCVLLAVYRGKMSEGISFNDNNARAVRKYVSHQYCYYYLVLEGLFFLSYLLSFLCVAFPFPGSLRWIATA
jgi:hypothetical protein